MIGFGHANVLVWIALFAFLPLSLVVFRLLPAPIAALALLLGGEMFLPAGGAVDLPGLPAMGKDLLVYTSVFLCLVLYQPQRLIAARPGTSLEILGVAMALGGVATVVNNMDPLQYGPATLNAMSLGEAPTAALEDVLAFAVPFLLGRALHRDSRDLRRLLSALTLAGLVYSVFAVIEMRLSPQFHYWVYGFIPISFDTAWRLGGYRPMVFMLNGLACAIFMATTMLAGVALARTRQPVLGLPPTPVGAWLVFMVMMTRSLAVMVLGALLAPVVAFLRPVWIARIAVAMVVFVAVYPLLRLSNLVSWDPIVEIARDIDPARARSMSGRFEVEGKLLEKARERFVFGWGGYMRNMVFDPVTGDRAVVPDGYWVLKLGARGLVGFVTDFGLCVIPVVVAGFRLRRVQSRRDQILLAALMLIIALRLVDWIPNGRWSSLPTFLAGALHSCSYAMARARRPARIESAPRVVETTPVVAAATAARVEKKAPRRMSETLRRAPEEDGG
jgi:hypothetical protein